MAEPTVLPAPSTRRGADVEVLHGVSVADPYRWLEDGDSEEVAAWVAAHNERTHQALEARPTWGPWHERLSALTLPTVASAAVRGERLSCSDVLPARPVRVVVHMLSSRSCPTDIARSAERARVVRSTRWFEPSPMVTRRIGLSEVAPSRERCRSLFATVASPLNRSPTSASSIAWIPTTRDLVPTLSARQRIRPHVYFHFSGPTASIRGVDDLPTSDGQDVVASDDLLYMLAHARRLGAHRC